MIEENFIYAKVFLLFPAYLSLEQCLESPGGGVEPTCNVICRD